MIVAVIGNIANIAGQKWMEKDLVFMMLANGVKPINKGVVMKDKIDALKEIKKIHKNCQNFNREHETNGFSHCICEAHGTWIAEDFFECKHTESFKEKRRWWHIFR